MLTTDAPVRGGAFAIRRPRAVLWVLLLASAAAIALTGAVLTALVLMRAVPSIDLASVPSSFWLWTTAACALSVLTLFGRALRWTFLLRRSNVRIPIRDANIGYFSGLALLIVPLLVGEIAVRANIQRRRGRVPTARTAALDVWEHALDLTALALVASAGAIISGQVGPWMWLTAGCAAILLAAPIAREYLLAASVAIGNVMSRRLAGSEPPIATKDLQRLTGTRTWIASVAASAVLWLLPGAAFWGLAGSWHRPLSIGRAESAFASAELLAGLLLAPGGVLVVGNRLLSDLGAWAFARPAAALTVLVVRAATVGIATMLGAVYCWIHLRSDVAAAGHFDEIAHAYDAQIPESRRSALLDRKTELMASILRARATGRRGLDVGCGQGWHVARMRALGFDVVGIDESLEQVATARRHVGNALLVSCGTALSIPMPDASFDFVYIINVLHHLATVEEQRAAFAEVARVLKPGGCLFLHEINTRNILFRFYMGYIFPSLNCIDEGVERWLLPNRLSAYTPMTPLEVEYFTFLPEFAPESVVRLMRPVERRLETSALRVFSAHYMAVLQKPV